MMKTEIRDPMLPRPYRVLRVRHEIPDTFTLDLAPEDEGDIPSFATGQFNMLYVFGIGKFLSRSVVILRSQNRLYIPYALWERSQG